MTTDLLVRIWIIGAIIVAVIGWGMILNGEWNGHDAKRGEYSDWAMTSLAWPITVPFLVFVGIYLLIDRKRTGA